MVHQHRFLELHISNSKLQLTGVEHIVYSPVGREVHSPRLRGDLGDDGEGATPAGCKLPGAYSQGEVAGGQPDTGPDSKSRLLATLVSLRLHAQLAPLQLLHNLGVNSGSGLKYILCMLTLQVTRNIKWQLRNKSIHNLKRNSLVSILHRRIQCKSTLR